MFRLDEAGLRYGHREVFKSLNWQVGVNDRVGLVGPNGAGKTTLLKVLAGLQELDVGMVFLGRATTCGYLPQEGIVHAGTTVFQEASSVFASILALKTRQEALHRHLEEIPHDNPSFDKLIEESDSLEHRFRDGGGYQLKSDVGTVLKGLGFGVQDWDRPTESFSGGWQMRLALCKLLLQRPNLLLLDEPTNHLDLEAREWLADYLQNYPFAIVLVSHDRYFLDKVVNRIAEIDHGTVVDYAGNYSHYESEKQIRRAAQAAAYRRQQEEIAQIEAFIERFRYKATKAAQVQSRLKTLEKLERIPPPAELPKSLKFRFPDPIRSGDIVVDLVGVTKSYGSNTVFEGVDVAVRRGDKVALVGPNGAGKSTLMRLLAGHESPDSGIRRLGHQALLSYFAQDQARTLTPGNTVLKELASHAPLAGEGLLRSLLGSFLFSGDDVFKRVEVLSGGEKNRLALCKLLASPGNLLLLDEPTNHLDMMSKEVLMEALRDFTGSLVFVSHDRTFIEALAGRVIEVGCGKIQDYPGTYREFLERRNRESGEESALERTGSSGSSSNDLESKTGGDTAEAHRERKRASRLASRIKDRIEQIQQEIELKEQNVLAMQEQMHDPTYAHNYDKLLELETWRTQLTSEIDALFEEWQTLSGELENSQ